MGFLNKVSAVLVITALVITSPLSAIAQGSSKGEKTGALRGGGKSFGTESQGGTGSINLSAPTGNPNLFAEPKFNALAYQIHVAGEVENPGTYRMYASTRLAEALALAGGRKNQGSRRRVEIKRMGVEGETIRTYDLLSFELFGDLNSNPYLDDNDVIFVPLQQRVVEIQGTVKRPGRYELIKEKTLEDLVRLAGGFTPGVGNPTPIKIIRFSHKTKEVLEVENSVQARKNFILESADVVVAPHFLTESNTFDYNLAQLPGDNTLFYPSFDERVFVLGAVQNPGPFPFSPYYTVQEYLTMAGGTTRLAKHGKVRITSVGGISEKARNDRKMNPGDVIQVPEKYMAPENLISLVLGITTSILGISTALLTISR